jgi:hypothetical protein
MNFATFYLDNDGLELWTRLPHLAHEDGHILGSLAIKQCNRFRFTYLFVFSFLRSSTSGRCCCREQVLYPLGAVSIEVELTHLVPDGPRYIRILELSPEHTIKTTSKHWNNTIPIIITPLTP